MQLLPRFAGGQGAESRGLGGAREAHGGVWRSESLPVATWIVSVVGHAPLEGAAEEVHPNRHAALDPVAMEHRRHHG